MPDDNARRGLLPDGPVTDRDAIRPYLDAIPRAERAVDRRRARDAHVQLRPDARSGLPAGARSTISSARRTSSSRATPTTTPSSGCRPTTRSSRARSSRRNQFFTGEYRNIWSDRTLQTVRFGYSRTRIGQNVEANLASPLPPFVDGRALVGDIDIGGMQRFGPQSSANLRLAQNVYSGQ